MQYGQLMQGARISMYGIKNDTIHIWQNLCLHGSVSVSSVSTSVRDVKQMGQSSTDGSGSDGARGGESGGRDMGALVGEGVCFRLPALQAFGSRDGAKLYALNDYSGLDSRHDSGFSQKWPPRHELSRSHLCRCCHQSCSKFCAPSAYTIFHIDFYNYNPHYVLHNSIEAEEISFCFLSMSVVVRVPFNFTAFLKYF